MASTVGALADAELWLPRRARAHRARRQAGARLPGRRQQARRRLGRQLRALRAAADRAAAARGERLPRLVRPALAPDAGRCRCGTDPAGGAVDPGHARAPLRQGLHRRPRRRGALASPARTSSRSPTTRPAASWPRCTLTGVDGYTFTGPHPRLGRAARRRGRAEGHRRARPGRRLRAGPARRRLPLGRPRREGSAAAGLAARACGCRVTPPRGGGWRCWAAPRSLALAAGHRGRGRDEGRRRRPRGRAPDARHAARGGRPAEPAPAGRPADDLELPGRRGRRPTSAAGCAPARPRA